MLIRMIDRLPTPGDTSWFTNDRFGMFIHWGLYALAARHEWVKTYEFMTDEHYQRYFDNFDPDLYDPDLWALTAADAGMKYFVITTKHHEGFSLWDSAQTDYKVTNTPYGRDVLKPMVAAFRNHGLHAGFYHSLIDWYHPHFKIDVNHPRRNDDNVDELNASRDQNLYAQFLHAQVRELLTEFGDIDVLWLDYSYPRDDGQGKGRDDWQSEKLYQLVRELKPNIILNDRLDLPEGWDIKTPEQYQPRQGPTVGGKPVVWEACQTFSGSWGYHRDEATWKSVDQLIRMLIDTVSKDGNLLLNVGPTGRGEFDRRAIDRLQGIGKWMKLHDRSIYGCTCAPDGLEPPDDCRYTYNPTTNRLYVHLFAWPFKQLHLDGLADRVAYAQLLNDASEILIGTDAWIAHQEQRRGIDSTGSDPLVLKIPPIRPDVTVPVIELILK